MYVELWNHIRMGTNPAVPEESKSDQMDTFFYFQFS